MCYIDPISVVKIVKNATALLYNLTHSIDECFN